MNTNNNSKPIVHLTQNTEDKTREAFRTLHTVFAVAVGLASLPSFDDCTPADFRKLTDRAADSLIAVETKRAEAKYGKLRGKVQALLNAKRAESLASVAEIANLSEATRKLLGVSVPESVAVSVSDLLPAFPANTSHEAAVKMLHEMRFPVAASPGRPGADGKRGQFVRVSLKDEAPAVETSQAAAE